MSSKKRGLGKGLNELLSATLGSSFSIAPENSPTTETAIEELAPHGQELRFLPIEKLIPSPFQPRQHIRHEGLEQLAESIKAQGVLQPIVARAKEDHFEIIAGERRWRAAQLIGLQSVPTLIRQVPDEAAMAMALIENIQREDLNPIEEALALKRLTEELQLTHLQVAEAVGKSRTSVTNLLRLLTLNSDVQALLEVGQLEMGHARALLALKGSLQSQMAKMVVERALSVRETERLVAAREEEPQTVYSKKATVDPNIRRLEEDLAEKLSANVKIRHGRKGRGMVVIRYHDVDELEGILAHFK